MDILIKLVSIITAVKGAAVVVVVVICDVKPPSTQVYFSKKTPRCEFHALAVKPQLPKNLNYNNQKHL